MNIILKGRAGILCLQGIPDFLYFPAKVGKPVFEFLYPAEGGILFFSHFCDSLAGEFKSSKPVFHLFQPVVDCGNFEIEGFLMKLGYRRGILLLFALFQPAAKPRRILVKLPFQAFHVCPKLIPLGFLKLDFGKPGVERFDPGLQLCKGRFQLMILRLRRAGFHRGHCIGRLGRRE